MVIPIMLRSFGRSGSTLLMQVLGTSNNVIFDRKYPFEQRHLTYLYRLACLIGSPTANDSDWNPDTVFSGGLKRVGPIPYSDVTIFDRKKLSDDLLKRLWFGFSAQIENYQKMNINFEAPIYYAEKVAHDICADVNAIVEAKNLFLFRDPRDEFISIKNFNAKRGFNGFGWGEQDDEQSFALKLCQMRRDFMRHISKIETDRRRILIRYEDFICYPEKYTDLLSGWIGLRLDYKKVESQRKSVEHHITSKSVLDSVGRWKSEMDKSVIKIFEQEIGEELSMLGYEL